MGAYTVVVVVVVYLFVDFEKYSPKAFCVYSSVFACCMLHTLHQYLYRCLAGLGYVDINLGKHGYSAMIFTQHKSLLEFWLAPFLF